VILRPLGAEPQPEWTTRLLTRALAAAAQITDKLVQELSASADHGLALAEARGSGPPLSLVPAAETAGTDDVMLTDQVGDESFPAGG
jgi:hypothetical protein